MFTCCKCQKSSKPGEKGIMAILETRPKSYTQIVSERHTHREKGTLVEEFVDVERPVEVNTRRRRTPRSFTETVREGLAHATCVSA
ncbi:Uncharacterised protein [uncultured archaeon]|nr:Uncharacterised protein [uncultured archaeon]